MKYYSSNRLEKISKYLHKEISFIIMHSLNNSKINRITNIIEVCISKDFSQAKVFVNFININIKLKEYYLNILNHSSGYIKKILSKKLKFRIIPEIIFLYDDSLDKGFEIENLLKRIIKKKKF